MPNILFMSHQISAITTIATDTFTRADSATTVGATTETGGKTYTVSNGIWGINTNQLYMPSGPSGDGLLTFDSGVSDFTFQVTIANIGTNDYSAGLVLRQQNSTNCYILWTMAVSGKYLLQRKFGGDANLSLAGTCANGDVVKVVCLGSSIKVSVNTIQIISVTDSTFTTPTVCGFRIGTWNSGIRLDTMSLTSP